MKILISSLFANFPFSVFKDHMCRWLLDNLPQDKIDVRFLMNEAVFNEAVNNHDISQYNPISISDNEIREIYTDKTSFAEICENIKEIKFTEDKGEKLKLFMSKKVPNWTPDIIISQAHTSGKDIWQNVFPNALCISGENAIFSRPPFNRTVSYDPFSAIPDWFPSIFAQEIKNFKITQEQDSKIEKLKKAITGIVDKYSKLEDEMMFYYKQKFDKLVLLPLIGDKFIKMFNDCIFDTEQELVKKVMENTPKNIGVFVTQADAYASLTPDIIDHLSTKYSNFLYLKKTDVRGYANNSLQYFKYIDAILNITSKTALMGLIWDKPVLSLSKQYNQWFQDGQGIDELNKVLNSEYTNKNNLLYWYFTRYVLFEQDFYQKDFLWNFLNNCILEYKNNGITFNFFKEINSMDKVFDYILKPVLRFYEGERSVSLKELRQETNNLPIPQIVTEINSHAERIVNIEYKLAKPTIIINKITSVLFSVKNKGSHKIWTILGIKMKFKRKISSDY